MKRRALAVAAAAIAMAAGAVWWFWAASRPLPVPRNVLLITLDTYRSDRLGCYGSTRGLTPHLDALAADATRFTNAFTPVPLTAPSHAAMLTGRYPITNGLRNNGAEVLSKDETLLSEILRGRGFETAAIVSALVLASQFGLNQGWDLYYEKDIAGSQRGHGLWFDRRRGDQTIDRANAWLEAESSRPFFLWVHLFDAHDPYDPPSPFKERFGASSYDGAVAFVDEQAGRLLDEVRRLGLYESTLILVSGDHGESLGEHGEKFHGIFLYNATTHVPLILRVPGARQGRVVTDLASTLDITPTILDALRVAPPTTMQGVSLLPAAARGRRVPARSLYLETIYPSASYGWAAVRALVDGSWKLVNLPVPELYQMARDPDEKLNLHGSEPGVATDLHAAITTLRAELKSSARDTETAPLDEETRDRLLALGYVAGEQSSASEEKGRDPKEVSFMMTPLSIASGMMRKHEFADAEEVFRKALELDPDNKIALLKIGQALSAQRKIDEAIPFFERAITVYPDLEEFYRTYGTLLLQAGRLDQAAAVFRAGSERIPRSAQMHMLLGYARFLAKDWATAAPELDLAIRMNPRGSKSYYLLAICRLESGDERSAMTNLGEYLKRDADVESVFNDPYFKKLRGHEEFDSLLRQYL